MDHLKEALNKRRGKGIDIAILIGKPHGAENESTKTDADFAPVPTDTEKAEEGKELGIMDQMEALHGRKATKVGEPEMGEGEEEKEMSLMEAMAALHKGQNQPTNPYDDMLAETENPPEHLKKSIDDHLTDVSDQEKEDLMGRKPKSLGERVRQMALKKRAK